MNASGDEAIDIEPETSHAAADVIFRTLFSIPIENKVARQVFEQFSRYQKTQPILNLAAFVPGPKWMPRLFKRDTKRNAKEIRKLISELTHERSIAIKEGSAPDDLATKIMTTKDPLTGETFSDQEMVDQVAIFFLAGHETSASALSWALYLLATHPEWQEKVAIEAQDLSKDFSSVSRLKVTRDVFREALRLYPPVPMMVREATRQEEFRNRNVSKGSQIVLSPWHLHRHERMWDCPDDFDPERWDSENGKECARKAYMPFSSGPRVCTGAGFAMVEGVVLLALLVRALRVEAVPGLEPVPIAHLTVRSSNGIHLRFAPRK